MISAASDLSHKSLFAARAEELEEILLREGIFLDEVLSLIEGVPKPRSITHNAKSSERLFVLDS